jgi:hypothetical protein
VRKCKNLMDGRNGSATGNIHLLYLKETIQLENIQLLLPIIFNRLTPEQNDSFR